MLSVGAVVGHLVPGAVLVYILLMLVMTGPGILLHVLPDSFYERLAKMRAALRGEDSEMGGWLPRCRPLVTRFCLFACLFCSFSAEIRIRVQGLCKCFYRP